jgi:hypothetical protein
MIRRYLKNPIVILSTLILLIWTIYYLYFDDQLFASRVAENVIVNIIEMIPLLFFLFMVISYELFYQCKKVKLEEVIFIQKKGKIKELGTIFLVLLSNDLILSVIVYLACIKYYLEKSISSTAFWYYSFRIVVIYIFLPMLFAIFLGLFAAKFNKRITGICVIMSLFFLFDSKFISFLLSTFLNNIEMSKVATIFCIFYRLAGAIVDENYFLTAENVHLYRLGFWIFLMITILCFKNKKTKIHSLLPLSISLCFLLLFFRPSGASYNFFNSSISDAWIHDQIYYSEYFNNYETNFKNYIDVAKINKNTFNILDYEIEFEITDILKAKVTMTPSYTNLDDYTFTLYHGYTISNVTDENGTPLDFQQNGDFLNIANKKGELKQIVIEYSGYSRFFYSTTQAVNLPGNFAYYPIPGWHEIYNTEEGNFNLNLLDTDAEFKVSIDNKGNFPLFSNLKSEISSTGSKNISFYGKTRALTLVGNPYLKTKEIQGVSVIYSELDNNVNPDKNEDYYQELFEVLKEYGYPLENIKVIAYRTGGYDNCCVTDDQAYGDILVLPDFIAEIQGDRDEK